MSTLTIEQIKESMKLIVTALNKSCKAGNYTLDEAYILKIACSNVEKLIEAFENNAKTIPVTKNTQQFDQDMKNEF